MQLSSTFIESSYGRLFIAVSAVTLFIVFFSISNRWHHLQQNTRDELHAIYSLVTDGINDTLHQKELFLNVLGERLKELGGLDNRQKMYETYDAALRDNPTFNGYAIIHPKGDILFMPNRANTDLKRNLLTDARTARSFNEVLQSDGLVIGHTYFSEPLDEWIIPIRMAIRNDVNEVLFVLSLTLAIDSEFNPWNSGELDNAIGTFLIHAPDEEDNYYLIYYPTYAIFGRDKENVYYEPLPDTFIHSVNEAATGKSEFSTLLDSNDARVFSFAETAQGRVPALVQIGFDERHAIFYGVRYKITSLYATLANFTVTVIPIGIICIIATFLGLRKLYRQDFDYKNQLRYEACHDQLTGLPNRYYATEFFDEWRQSFANKISALFIDLDNFKFINDHFGHNTGDIVLQQIVTRLKQFERTDNALLIRHGGDEFVCLLPLTGKQRIIETSKRVLEQIKLPIHCNDLRFSITASIGISIYDHISDGLETLLSKSDTAMLEAKKLKNHFSFYSDRLKKRNERNAEIKSEISSAIENNEFYVVYQAQVDAKTERLRGFETLMRWHSDKLGNVPPNEFIPILESSGQIVQLSEMMIRLVFEEFEQISKTPGLSVSINVSVHQLIYGNFRGFLNREVSRFSISPEQIILEVTESLFIEDINQVGRTLQNLKEDGFLISLDDFGTGYSSLGSIRALPFSELKVDRSFVSGILEDPSDEILVKQIIDIGHNQNTHVVAEGVESKEQVYLLRELGCDLLQGFYFSKPISIKEVKEHYCHELHVA